ncbi:hypothetical protein [Mucilaginibacter kameinonensis]|uniref:hypothetical protein n=1 Tax=Mucilaginibacter kameinonensis TaxID=452286 RepID=UPI000EF785A6|nr:hypothetical protein [Mucilaginibacter kameinonensis]
MQDIIITPTAIGQICKIENLFEDENPNDVYIVTEDPTPFDLEDSIYVTNLSDLQKNLHAPLFTPQHAVAKGDLNVIADSLEGYINSFNHK